MESKLNKIATKGKCSRSLPIVLILLIVIGVVQDPFLINLELLWQAPGLLPFADFHLAWESTVCTFVAAGFLLCKAKQVCTVEWRISFLVMMLPYLFLKAIGVYWDTTCYIIAAAEGRHIGGGAAFGHLFLGVYILGPAQLLSAIVFWIVRNVRLKSMRTTSM